MVVSLMVSFFEGQVTLFNSSIVSRAKWGVIDNGFAIDAIVTHIHKNYNGIYYDP